MYCITVEGRVLNRLILEMGLHPVASKPNIGEVPVGIN